MRHPSQAGDPRVFQAGSEECGLVPEIAGRPEVMPSIADEWLALRRFPDMLAAL